MKDFRVRTELKEGCEHYLLGMDARTNNIENKPDEKIKMVKENIKPRQNQKKE